MTFKDLAIGARFRFLDGPSTICVKTSRRRYRQGATVCLSSLGLGVEIVEDVQTPAPVGQDDTPAVQTPDMTPEVDGPETHAPVSYDGRPSKWKCPACQAWVREDMNKRCASCTAKMKEQGHATEVCGA